MDELTITNYEQSISLLGMICRAIYIYMQPFMHAESYFTIHQKLVQEPLKKMDEEN